MISLFAHPVACIFREFSKISYFLHLSTVNELSLVGKKEKIIYLWLN